MHVFSSPRYLRSKRWFAAVGSAALLGLVAWSVWPSGWWRIEVLIRAEPRKENGWSVVQPYSLLHFLDDGRQYLFTPEFFAGLDGTHGGSVRPVALEQYRCSSIVDVTVETRRPESGPAIATYTSANLMAAMRTNYPELTFEFVDHRLREQPSRLRRFFNAMSRW